MMAERGCDSLALEGAVGSLRAGELLRQAR
jgi:hypothetical protein